MTTLEIKGDWNIIKGNLKQKWAKLTDDDLQNLARTQFRGKRPETVEDWAYLYEFLKRTFED